ncbi:MBL fold metallo-hydrolase [Ideonella sp. DXS29W]|uniref:MBL fold metallo-hydrolase n=1 Tax=Ideonella lacteola TaxID=2984193 RepID=A0ABU9BI96_9BURK
MAGHVADRLQIESFYDPATSTFSHLLLDAASGDCALVDTVLDFDPKSGRTGRESADRLIARVKALGARLVWLLETHVHADHLSAAAYIQQQLGGQIAIGQHITTVQATFGRLFNVGPEFKRDGSQFDRLLAEGEVITLGTTPLRVMHTPGHTPACTTYVAGEGDQTVAFIGDTLFRPDYGSARCDFPGGDASTLYRSVRRLLSLPPSTRLYFCHDYPEAGQAPSVSSTVAAQREGNIHLHDGIAEEAFVAMRRARDAGLAMPVLILPSVQVNMRAGHLPPPEDNGVSYLKLPLDAL